MEKFTLNIEELLLSLVPCLVMAVLAVVLPMLCRRLLNRLIRRLKGHVAQWLDIFLEAFTAPLVQIMRCTLVMLALLFLPFTFNGAAYQRVVWQIYLCAMILSLGWGFWRASPLCRLLFRSAQNRLDLKSTQTVSRFFENIYRALVGVFTGIALLDCFGVPVTGLLTGAGVAGLAVSLAAQSTLSSFIAGVTLVLEHPFGIGDYISIGSFEGTVEDISFRSTRMRTVDNTVITVENSKVCAEYIQNLTERDSRLWTFTVGVTYDTPPEKIKAVCAGLTAMFNQKTDIRPGSVEVNLAAFGASSIDIEVRCYVMLMNITAFRAFKNSMHLQIMDLMARQGCEFAFPSATVYLQGAEN